MVSYRMRAYRRTHGLKWKGFHLLSWCKAFGGSEILSELLSGCLGNCVCLQSREERLSPLNLIISCREHFLVRSIQLPRKPRSQGYLLSSPRLVRKSRAPLLLVQLMSTQRWRDLEDLDPWWRMAPEVSYCFPIASKRQTFIFSWKGSPLRG